MPAGLGPGRGNLGAFLRYGARAGAPRRARAAAPPIAGEMIHWSEGGAQPPSERTVRFLAWAGVRGGASPGGVVPGIQFLRLCVDTGVSQKTLQNAFPTLQNQHFSIGPTHISASQNRVLETFAFPMKGQPFSGEMTEKYLPFIGISNVSRTRFPNCENVSW